MAVKLGLYILSYRRAEFLKEALDSAIKQTYPDLEIIVSDNTPDDSVQNELTSYLSQYPRIRFIRRQPSLPALEHFNQILTECKAFEYAMLFHDDDILLPNAVALMMAAIEQVPQASAVSCNAYFMEGKTPTTKLFNPHLTSPINIKGPGELIKRYTLKRLSHTPFPSYIYRTQMLGTVKLDPADGGKYSDVSFLVKLIRSGYFVWINRPLIYYRRHAENDSGTLDIKAIARLSYFFLKVSPSSALYISLYLAKYIAKKLLLSLKY